MKFYIKVTKFPIRPCFVKYELHLYEKYAKIYTSCSGKAFRQTNNEILFALHQRARRLSPGFLVCVKVRRLPPVDFVKLAVLSYDKSN